MEMTDTTPTDAEIELAISILAPAIALPGGATETLLRAYRAEKERRESAERVVAAAYIYTWSDGFLSEQHLVRGIAEHIKKYPSPDND